ncbi:RNA polymerase sigma-70 factor [Sphingobacterium spiritivorum]|uniref:RNA polymerase sigma-70 factor n=1 Tax=Sphingobacterium spiritivorum TaxID=258 RepID=UPI003DA666B4
MVNFRNYSDQDLILLLNKSDVNAYTEIYNRYAMMVYYNVNQILRDEESSKDVVQDVFTSLWDKKEVIMHGENLAGYLYVSCRHRVFKLLEKGKVRNNYLLSIASYFTDNGNQTYELLDERELMGIVVEEIAKLPQKMRVVFELSRLENLTHREIAVKLGISEKTVKTQVHNALTILRLKLKNYGSYGILILLLSTQKVETKRSNLFQLPCVPDFFCIKNTLKDKYSI